MSPPACFSDPIDVRTSLLKEDTVDGVVDYRGRPAVRSRYGRWKSAAFIIGLEITERMAFMGTLSNLINYMTGPLGMSTAIAAANVNAWSGVGFLLPLLGAVIADSFLGHYRTIAIASSIYIMGLGLLTLSAMMPFHNYWSSEIHEPPKLKVILAFVSMYMISIGQGGHKPCVQAFAADQFDGTNAEESVAKSSFFNWWNFFICIGPLLSISAVTYIEDNISWSIGFGILCGLMFVALVIFLLGTGTYRYAVKSEEVNSPFKRIGKVIVGACRNWRSGDQILPHNASRHLRFLYKATLPSNESNRNNVCSIDDVDDTIAVLRVIPVWIVCFVYGTVVSQVGTFFTKQGTTLNRTLGFGVNFQVPAASLMLFSGFFTILFIPIYDRFFVPLMRKLTGKPAGITMLQRLGIGLSISVVTMIVAALVERKRLQTALEYGLIDSPHETIPMSFWWLVIQYGLLGTGDVFTIVSMQEFFYDQVPSDMKSAGLSLYLSIFGAGSMVSSVLVSVIQKVTSDNGSGGWFNDNINQGHIDYFYWFLAGLSAIQLALFICISKCYVYNYTRIVKPDV